MPILAKSEPPYTLKKHIDDALSVSAELRFAFDKVGKVFDDKVFWRNLKYSIILHDIGKAHSEFQKVLKGKSNKWDFQRHELFSLPFVVSSSEYSKEIYYTVAGHHKPMDKLGEIISGYDTSNPFNLNLEGIVNNNSFKDEFKKVSISKALELLKTYDINIENLSIPKIEQIVTNFNKYTESEINRHRLLLFSGAFKHCDHLASAGCFELKCMNSSHFQFLHDSGYTLYEHQQKAGTTVGNALLTAPTGSGKTETSLLWLENQLKNTGQGRTFYILPFTASINAMYKRLDKDIPDKVGMLHGKLTAFLDDKFGNDDMAVDKIKKVREQFRSLTMPIKVVTPFQLLKNLFTLKGYEKGIFEWLGGYFIFDEIHAYNPSVFAQIVVLIEFVTKKLGVTVFIMTATLPHHLRKELERAMGKHAYIGASSELYSQFTRHRAMIKKGLIWENLEFIQSHIDEGKKVLVVCNTVKQSQVIYEMLDCSNKVLLHSSFNANDRSQKEKQLFDEDVRLLVGTQAIEVSLDINYDVIFTEVAPLDALIQRFGRVNRKPNNEVKDCYVFEQRNQVDKFIYRNTGIIKRTIEVIRNNELVNEGVIKEIELQDMIDYVYPYWSEEDRDEYDTIYSTLSYVVEKELMPFSENKKREEDFYEQFDGVKVLPIKFLRLYQELLEENKFIKAENLKVQVSEKRYFILKSNGDIEKERTIFESKKTKRILEETVWILAKKYNSELGLQLDVDETNHDLTQFL